MNASKIAFNISKVHEICYKFLYKRSNKCILFILQNLHNEVLIGRWLSWVYSSNKDNKCNNLSFSNFFFSYYLLALICDSDDSDPLSTELAIPFFGFFRNYAKYQHWRYYFSWSYYQRTQLQSILRPQHSLLSSFIRNFVLKWRPSFFFNIKNSQTPTKY